MNPPPFRQRRFLQLLCAIYAALWILAAIHPVDRQDWFLENLLVFAFVPLLIFNYRAMALSDAAWLLTFLFLCLHAMGAHYTYAEAPFGYWLRDLSGATRNHFDRIVHFSFGLLLTYPTAEVMARTLRLRGHWAPWLPAALVVGASGLFEIIEAVIAWLVSPELGTAYLGTQGDVWDAQKDMALAILGSLIATFLTPRHRLAPTAS
jgi:putative membrane protein